jgi:SRSO17 transposase
MIATPTVDPRLLQDLDAYIDLLRGAFRRSDQARWAAVYLQGLLGPCRRKNIESLAETAVLPPGSAVDDVAQALQNFVNQSPWDEQRLWQRYRALMAERPGPAPGLLWVEDVTFPKQGRHSVGVLRQYSSAFGRKINCQVAVSLHAVGPAGHVPLALRLYLPRKWLEAPARLEAAAVPPECRVPRGKAEIALELLDRVRDEGWPAQEVAAGPAYGTSAAFREGLAALGLAFHDVRDGAGPGGDALEQGLAELRELGLDHFEGRSWRGFHHHACLVMLAYGFRMWSRGRR